MGKLSSQLEESLKGKDVVIVDPQPSVDPVTLNKDLSAIAAEEAFMNEIVTIVLLPTTDPNAPPYATLSVNGERAIVPRNKKVDVKRKHLEVLARMKETRYTQNLNPNQQGEITPDALFASTGLVYPFTIVRDANERGGEWLANILAEAA